MRTLFSILLLTAISAAAQTCPSPGAPGQKDTVPLCAVVNQVKLALQQYQSSLGSGKDALPPLAKADFDFKTTNAATAGGKISLFVFTLGVGHEKDITNDVLFTYKLPEPKPKVGLAPHIQPPLSDQLYATIRGAAEQVKMAEKVGDLPFSGLVVTMQFCVKTDLSGGVNAPISLVTVGLSGDKSRNTTQSVTLTFVASDKPKR